VLRSRWPWLGLAIAIVLTLPNLAWQTANGWPSVAFAGSQNAKTAEDTPPLTYVAQQLFLGAGIVVVVVGVVVLWRRRETRPLALVPPFVTCSSSSLAGGPTTPCRPTRSRSPPA
jgi:hypothetical protein